MFASCPTASFYPTILRWRQPETFPEDLIRKLDDLGPDDQSEFFQHPLDRLLASMRIDKLRERIRALDSDFTTEMDLAKRIKPLPVASYTTQTDNHSPVQSTAFFRFFANLVDTFATAINFYDQSDPPASIYEKQVLITIYYRFFQIPFALSPILAPLVWRTWQSHVVALAVLATTTTAVYSYQKWLRPFPTTIPGCELNQTLVRTLHPRPLVGPTKELDDLIFHLKRRTRSNAVMILGPTGNGKTTLMHRLQQRIDSGDVPAELRNKKIVTINGGHLMAKCSNGIGDKLKQIRHALSGFESQTIIYIDELQALAERADTFELIKEFMRDCGMRCVTSTTQEAFDAVIKVKDKDHSFRRSYGTNYIQIQKWSEGQIEELLQGMIGNAPDVQFSPLVAARVRELADSILPELAQPAKAVELMEVVIDRFREKDPAVRAAAHEMQKLLERQDASAAAIRDHGSRAESIAKRLLFDHFYLLPKLQQLTRTDTELDVSFVDEVFADFKRIKESAHQ